MEQASDPKYAYLWHSTANSYMGAGKARRGRPKGSSTRKSKVEAAMREVHRNIPSTVKRANVSGKRKEAMLRAIAFAKASKR